MQRTVGRTAIFVISLLVVGYPLFEWYKSATFTPGLELLLTLYPAFGLLAATIMYLHIIGRPFQSWLTEYGSFKIFERVSSYVVLVSFILHPVLRGVYFLARDISLVPSPEMQLPITLGLLGFLMLITYDLGKTFIKSPLVEQWWWLVDIVSTIGFYVIWLHALMIGSHLQEGLLRSVWIFYGVTALTASFCTFLWSRRRDA